ncbi:E3 SUMO-protein ligase PIAS2 [Thelohanellus kitauei]|uniref:E3 SUMO-protein ligase PIAS2 n=1 Tax=Thelohanellus kitauei TaxID=669202 RepID=A0A0C2J8S4_THEKT|nr:E3 SUMO-protein ligase PIAS2 [Thelohanellus kitauei]
MRRPSDPDEVKSAIRRLRITELRYLLQMFSVSLAHNAPRQTLVAKVNDLIRNEDPYISSTARSVILSLAYRTCNPADNQFLIRSTTPQPPKVVQFAQVLNGTGISIGWSQQSVANPSVTIPVAQGNFRKSIQTSPGLPSAQFDTFYVHSVIVPPTCLNPDLENLSNQRQSFFSFKLLDACHTILRERQIGRDGTISYGLSLYLRIGVIDTSQNMFIDKYNKKFMIEVNRKVIEIKDKFDGTSSQCFLPINITSSCSLYPLMTNYVTIKVLTDQPGKFYYSLIIGRKKNKNEICQQVLNNPMISIDQSLAILKQPKSDDQDIQFEGKLVVSLRCPISLTIMQTPVRFMQCKHVQCFDLESYLSLMLQYPTFICPVCEFKGSLKTLHVDQFMKKILHENPDCGSVSIEMDGHDYSIHGLATKTPESDDAMEDSSLEIDKTVFQITSNDQDSDDDVIFIE